MCIWNTNTKYLFETLWKSWEESFIINEVLYKSCFFVLNLSFDLIFVHEFYHSLKILFYLRIWERTINLLWFPSSIIQICWDKLRGSLSLQMISTYNSINDCCNLFLPIFNILQIINVFRVHLALFKICICLNQMNSVFLSCFFWFFSWLVLCLLKFNR